ncbi:sialidase family protein [Chitinophaga qingshengii]|uniref:exo-alpha-sialidase n=1 Tax=Chitinophaga qingshengii TaxID=1569794 RepID=A0ABR7TUH2_9BACT|nr:sialidase family protein [Chitinophaga qingshengii]MBC9933086.1 exo-alpha-sialidase [Chitinophaga qingshengii]
MKRTILLFSACLLLLASCKGGGSDHVTPAPPPGNNGGGNTTDTIPFIFKEKSGGYSCYRIPAIVKSKNGVLLAFAEARKNNCKDEGDIDLLVKRSGDGGKTWGDALMVWSDGSNTCGNPVPVLDEQTGRIYLLMTWNLGEDNIGAINAGTGKDTRRVFVTSSDDEGLTWAPAKEITKDVKKPGWAWYGTGPCHGIQLKHGTHAGRLVIPCDYMSLKTADSPSRDSAHVIYSDDHGTTWKLGGIANKDRGAESTVAELSDGQLMLNIRNSAGGARLVANSTDGGASWLPVRADYTLVEPICQGSLLSYKQWLFFSNPASTARENMTIKMSTDDGNNWSKSVKVYSGPAAYSDIVMLSDTHIAIFYEAGYNKPYEGIAYKVIPVTDFK